MTRAREPGGLQELRLHWLDALDAAGRAVDAASRTHILSAAACAAERKRLVAERAWVDAAIGRD